MAFGAIVLIFLLKRVLIDNGAPEDPNMKDPTHLQCVYGGATGNFESKGPFISAIFMFRGGYHQ